MTQKTAFLAEAREDFVRRWQPKDDDRGSRRDFRTELDQLIYAAIGVGQEPYVKELEMFREHSLKSAMLTPPTIKP